MNIQFAVSVSFVLLLAALLITIVRIIKGPEIQNRIVAMDLLASVVMGIILLYSIHVNMSVYIDAVIIISLISFIGTVSISTYLKN